jgi:hypothetical protein
MNSKKSSTSLNFEIETQLLSESEFLKILGYKRDGVFNSSE